MIWTLTYESCVLAETDGPVTLFFPPRSSPMSKHNQKPENQGLCHALCWSRQQSGDVGGTELESYSSYGAGKAVTGPWKEVFEALLLL